MGLSIKLALVVVFLLSIGVASASYNATYQCFSERCVEGEEITWYASIDNFAGPSSLIKKVMIIDYETDEIISIKNDVDEEIESGEDRQITLNSIVPQKDYINYVPCFKIEVTDRDSDNYGQTNTYCSEYPKMLDIVLKQDMECDLRFGDTDCGENEICVNYECESLVCGPCQYQEKRQCIDYQCCDSSACDADKECIDHECVSLNCTNNEYGFGHKCILLNCADNEIAYNHACNPLYCAEDEFAANHACNKLNCKFYQNTNNHECAGDLWILFIFITVIIIIAFLVSMYFIRVNNKEDNFGLNGYLNKRRVDEKKRENKKRN